FEFADLQKEHHHLKNEHAHLKETSFEEIKRKDLLLCEYQKTISEQRHVLEKKQKVCDRLNDKVKLLTEEIKTLLQHEGERTVIGQKSINENGVSSYYSIPMHELSQSLRKCLDKTENLTGASHFGGPTPRFSELSLDNFAVDKRRLS